MKPEALLSSSPFRLDLANQCLWRGTQEIPLTPKAFTVLRYLMASPGQLVTKEELLNAAWPGIYVSDAALKVCIRRLRQVLGDLVQPSQYIETVHWRGYRFIGKIDLSEPPRPVASTPLPADKSQHPVGDRRPAAGGSYQQLATGSWQLAATPVGRDTELTQFQGWLHKALEGERQMVFVGGEPGIGKTTVVEAFLARTGQTPHIWLSRGQCIEHYGAGEAYLPVLEALHRLCRTPQQERLTTLLSQHAPMWLTQFPSLLKNTTARKRLRHAVQGVSRERMLREFAAFVEALTLESPVILVLEDLHWSDSATLDLLSFLARRQEPAKLLLIGTYRPGAVVGNALPLKTIIQELRVHRQCEELGLEVLPPAAIATYLAMRFPGHRFPETLAQVIHQRTDGHPLFMVNVIEHLVTQGLIMQHDQQWLLQGSLEAIRTEVPVSIQQSIELQIDRLGPDDQRVLEVASVAGVEFSAAAVAAGLEAPVIDIEERCESLARRVLFLHSCGAGEWPDGTVATRYEFTHSLYHQAWYERVTAGRRALLHLRIAEREEAAYGLRAGEIATELAVHFERGRDYHRALQYRRHAAENALQRFGYQEAIIHLCRGLELLRLLPDTPERSRQEIFFQNTLGSARMAVQGYAALEVEQAYARAQFLCNQVEDPAQLSQTLRGLWAYYLTRADLQTARTLAEQLLDLAQHEHNSALLLEADRELGQTLYFLGEFPRARQHLEQSLARYERQQHASHTVVYGQDPGVVCRSQGARTLWVLGYPDQAIQYLQAALSLGQEIAHPYSLALARYHATVVHRARGDVRMTREMAEATIALATEHGFLYWLSVARILRGWALVQQGQGELGLAEMLHGLADHLATGAELNRPYALALLAGAHGKVGQAKEGLVVLAEALTLVQKIGQHFHHAELYRLKGQLTLQKFQVAESRVGIAHQKVRIAEAEPVGGAHPTGEDEAEEYFHQAIEISRQQEAKSLELRATTSLARLWQQLGKKKEARQLLREIYAWFTEGFDTGDLKEAKALLEKLS